MFEKMMEDWMKFQQKMTPDLSSVQNQAMEGINKLAGEGEKWQKFMENSIKFQKAYIAQQQAMLEMMEAMTENAKILSNK